MGSRSTSTPRCRPRPPPTAAFASRATTRNCSIGSRGGHSGPGDHEVGLRLRTDGYAGVGISLTRSRPSLLDQSPQLGLLSRVPAGQELAEPGAFCLDELFVSSPPAARRERDRAVVPALDEEVPTGAARAQRRSAVLRPVAPRSAAPRSAPRARRVARAATTPVGRGQARRVWRGLVQIPTLVAAGEQRERALHLPQRVVVVCALEALTAVQRACEVARRGNSGRNHARQKAITTSAAAARKTGCSAVGDRGRVGIVGAPTGGACITLGSRGEAGTCAPGWSLLRQCFPRSWLAKIAPKTATPIEPPIWRRSVEPELATPRRRHIAAACW